MPGYGAAADPRPPLFELEGPSFASALTFSFSFSAARSRMFPPFMTPASLRPTSNCLDSSPSMGHDGLPEPSEITGAREGAGVRTIEVPEYEGRNEGVVDVAWSG